MNIRVRFGKEGALKQIGHLDVLRTFQKIFRRAEIPMGYSGGFSPHPIMSFALPLGLGLTSEGEYLDAEIADGFPTAEILPRLKAATAAELPVYAVRILPEKTENAMSSVGRASYRVTLPQNMPIEAANSAFKAILARETINLTKKTKTREIELDIRPFLYDLRVKNGMAEMTLAAGSVANIKPEAVLELLADETGVPYRPADHALRRTDLMDKNGRSLGLVGEEP